MLLSVMMACTCETLAHGGLTRCQHATGMLACERQLLEHCSVTLSRW